MSALSKRASAIKSILSFTPSPPTICEPNTLPLFLSAPDSQFILIVLLQWIVHYYILYSEPLISPQIVGGTTCLTNLENWVFLNLSPKNLSGKSQINNGSSR